MLFKILATLNPETLAFIAFITILALAFHIRFTPATAAKAPAILTTCGILGTFFGVAIGLMEFNPANIQQSVPALIDGIKTAFWASAWGITCALTIKLREMFFGVRRGLAGTQVRGATVDDLAAIMTAMYQETKLTREDSNQKLNSLTLSLDNFATKIAQNNSKALIDALKEVIRDFNTKINEQFGDNFKQLNQGVEKLLVWQKEYRGQMEEMIKQQQATTKTMGIATERYQTLVAQAEPFNTLAKNMAGILTGLETQRAQLDGSLKSLASLLTTAGNSVPQLEKHIIEMTQQVSSGVKNANDEVKAAMLGVIRNSNAEFNTQIRQIIEHTREQVSALDKALSSELTKSLESLARQLSALSQKFAEDYSPITDKLQRVLQIAS